jgi:hypothetical protein
MQGRRGPGGARLVVVQERLDLAAEGADLVLVQNDLLGHAAPLRGHLVRAARRRAGCLLSQQRARAVVGRRVFAGWRGAGRGRLRRQASAGAGRALSRRVPAPVAPLRVVDSNGTPVAVGHPPASTEPLLEAALWREAHRRVGRRRIRCLRQRRRAGACKSGGRSGAAQQRERRQRAPATRFGRVRPGQPAQTRSLRREACRRIPGIPTSACGEAQPTHPIKSAHCPMRATALSAGGQSSESGCAAVHRTCWQAKCPPQPAGRVAT